MVNSSKIQIFDHSRFRHYIPLIASCSRTYSEEHAKLKKKKPKLINFEL
jgi:hypothetical protein